MYSDKYSVLMSVYFKENPKYFALSIESMLSQTIKPDEIVIVKDGPLTEELDAVIEYYVSKEPGLFTIVSLEKNLGLGLALNEGLKECRNELVARMDTDDISLENRCELQIKEFNKNNKLSVVGTWTYEFFNEPSNITTLRVVPKEHKNILKFSRRRSPFNHPTVMYKKSEVLRCGGYHNIKRKEDFDLFIRMLNQGCITMNIDKPLLLYRSNEENYNRRKSWLDCKGDIDIIYKCWRKGYSSLTDLIVVTIGRFILFISPLWLMKILSDTFLRKKYHTR